MRAVVFDLDGTAIPNVRNGLPSERLVRAAEAAHGRLALIAATGRPVGLAAPVFQRMHLVAPCVVAGGAMVVDPAAGEVLRKVAFDRESSASVTEVICDYEVETMVITETMYESLAAGVEPAEPLLFHAIGVGRPDAEAMAARLHSIDGVEASLTPDWAGTSFVVHVTPSGATKEHAVEWVLDHLGIERHEVTGVGDGGNDVHLFAAVGHCVAMGNADDALKEIADEVTASVDEDGLALVIEELLAR